jgi:hypothetical protein
MANSAAYAGRQCRDANENADTDFGNNGFEPDVLFCLPARLAVPGARVSL